MKYKHRSEHVLLLGWTCWALVLGSACSDKAAISPGTGNRDAASLGPDTGALIARQNIGAAGGVVREGRVAIEIPEGALSRTTAIVVKHAASYPADPRLMRDAVYEFEPDGLRFTEPVLVTIRYERSALPERVAEGSLRLHKAVDGHWQLLEETAVDATHLQVTGVLHGFSTYGVRGQLQESGEPDGDGSPADARPGDAVDRRDRGTADGRTDEDAVADAGAGAPDVKPDKSVCREEPVDLKLTDLEGAPLPSNTLLMVVDSPQSPEEAVHCVQLVDVPHTGDYSLYRASMAESCLQQRDESVFVTVENSRRPQGWPQESNVGNYLVVDDADNSPPCLVDQCTGGNCGEGSRCTGGDQVCQTLGTGGTSCCVPNGPVFLGTFRLVQGEPNKLCVHHWCPVWRQAKQEGRDLGHVNDGCAGSINSVHVSPLFNRLVCD